MLIWIKVPYVSIGVLASFVLLLSTVVATQRDLNTTSDEVHTFSTQEETDSVRIMDLPFAQTLKNPCSWDGSYNGPSHITFMGPRANFIKEFFTFVKHYSRIYKEDVEAMLRNHTISGCADLHVDSLPNTPTLEELKEIVMEEALKKIYLSLLVHSAYSFIVHYQVNSSNIRCSYDIEGEQNLAKESHTMALKQKALACYVLVGMTVLGFEKGDVTPLLNVRVSDLSLCSRRALRDCQVMNSAKKFLQELQNYATEDHRKSSTSLHDPVSSPVSTVSITPTVSTLSDTISEISSTVLSSTTTSSSSTSTLSTTSSSLESISSSERTTD